MSLAKGSGGLGIVAQIEIKPVWIIRVVRRFPVFFFQQVRPPDHIGRHEDDLGSALFERGDEIAQVTKFPPGTTTKLTTVRGCPCGRVLPPRFGVP